MDEFVVDASLFAKAQDKIIAASEAFSSISSLLSSVKANFPEEYEYKSEVIDACGDIDEAKSYVETFKAKVAEVCANLASLDEEFAKEVYSPKWYEDLWNAYKKSGSEIKKGVKSLIAGEGTGELKKALKDTGATIAVTGTSIVAGGLKLVEYVYDGSTYADGAIRYVAAKTGDAIKGTDNASKVWDETLDAVRVDIVGDVYNAFYETRFGQKINNASNLKYDSKGAKALKTGGEFAGKVALATAATVATGGTAAPMILGALYGVGKAEEKYAQSVDRENGESYDIKRANTKAVVNAITGAIEFYGYGQIGGMLAAKGTMKGAAGSLKDMISNGTKVEGKTFAKNFVKNFVAKDTLYDSAAVVADHAGNVYLGDESFSQALKSGGGEFALALGLNMLGAGMGAYVESATPVVKNVDVSQLDGISFDNKNIGISRGNALDDILDSKHITVKDVSNSGIQKASKTSVDGDFIHVNKSIEAGNDWKLNGFDNQVKVKEVIPDNTNRPNGLMIDDNISTNSNSNFVQENWRFDDKGIFSKNIAKSPKAIEDVEYALQQFMKKYNVPKAEAISRVKQIIKTGDYNYMTSYGGARDILKNYSIKDLKLIMAQIQPKPVVPKVIEVPDIPEWFDYPDSFFARNAQLYSVNYGVNQGGVYDHCIFHDSSGNSYSYREACYIYEDAIKRGKPLPRFKKMGDSEYFELKDILSERYGFNNNEASIILSTVDDAGACSYAATCNEIFDSFKNSPELFKEKFGFDMYKIIDGQKVANYNELLVDMYVNVNMVENGGRFISRTPDGLCTINTNLLQGRIDPLGRRILDSNQQQYLSHSGGKAINEINNYLNSKGIKYEATQIVDNHNGLNNADMNGIIKKMQEGLLQGKEYTLGIYQGEDAINMVSCNPSAYPSASTHNWNEGGGHALFITGLDKKGFVVSSWGKKYIVPYKDLLKENAPWTLNESIVKYWR